MRQPGKRYFTGSVLAAQQMDLRYRSLSPSNQSDLA